MKDKREGLVLWMVLPGRTRVVGRIREEFKQELGQDHQALVSPVLLVGPAMPRRCSRLRSHTEQWRR